MSMNVARPHGPGPKMGGRMDQRGGGPRGPPNRNQTPNRNQGFQNRNQGDRNHGNQVIKQENKDKDNGTPSHRPRGGDREKNERNQNQSEQNMEEDEPVGAGKKTEKKFTQRCRLFVGNLTPDTTEDQFKEMFRKYGEVSEVFLNTSKGFGFIRLDTRLNAETAKAELDGIVRKGRTVRVRFATHGAALRVKNIPQSCSNELLAEAFAQFGVVERAVVIVDDRGRPTGEGIVEFARKPGAQNALQKIREGVFLLSALPTPISAEPLEQKDEEDGQQEKNIQKNQQYHRERDAPPRFAQPGSFEHKWGMQWKHLEESEKMQRQQLERSFEDNRAKMEEDIEISKREHQAELMRQDLQRRQAELIRLEEAQKEFLQRRQQMQQQREEQMLRQQQQQQEEAVVMRRRQDEMRLQQDIRRRGGNDDMGSRDQAMQRMRGGMNQSKGMGAGGPGGMMGSGSGGGNGNGGGQGDNANQGSGGMGQGFMQQRQSRFDQPPGMGGGPGGRGGNAGPGGRGPGGPGGRGPGGPGGPSGMGGPGFGGPRGGMDEGPMRGTRRPPMDRPDMERGGRDRGDDYGKRPRRF